ncbi:hypothetical protein [Streptomyces sp. NPDC051109]|uniref:hypothetical protein n=1 Tax=Streptomyces sp. NPDC051109 TaxID=3365642 RepID=UPI0037B63AD4
MDHQPEAQIPPHGQPRRGMPVVAALSEGLVPSAPAAARAEPGSQRDEHGVPTTDLTPVEVAGPTCTPRATGITVDVRPAESLRAAGAAPTAEELVPLPNVGPCPSVEIGGRRAV